MVNMYLNGMPMILVCASPRGRLEERRYTTTAEAFGSVSRELLLINDVHLPQKLPHFVLKAGRLFEQVSSLALRFYFRYYQSKFMKKANGCSHKKKNTTSILPTLPPRFV